MLQQSLETVERDQVEFRLQARPVEQRQNLLGVLPARSNPLASAAHQC